MSNSGSSNFYLKIKKVAISSLFFLFLNLSLFAGVVTLISGEVITAEIIESNERYIKLDINGELRTIERGSIASVRGRKPDFISVNAEKVSFDRALKLASQGAFLHAEAMFKALAGSSDSAALPSKALEIINDFRGGLIAYDYALALFQGAYHISTRNFQKAIDIYEQALIYNPQAAEIYYNLANAYLATGDAETAVVYLEKLTAIDVDDPEITLALVLAYQSLARHQAAVDNLNKLALISPDDPEIYSLLASSYYALGRDDLGKESFRKARHLFQERGQFDRAEKIGMLMGNLP